MTKIDGKTIILAKESEETLEMQKKREGMKKEL
jgi:hypothetical protein